jgi:phosphoribosyl-AMP cyclohydrolase
MSTTICFAERTDKAAVEQGERFCPKFDADGLIPAMAVDADTLEPLMLAYMNEDSLRRTLELGEAVYWSRSRREIWHKGATSGHVQEVVEIRTDCDQDALILRVRQKGAGACHTGHRSCFYRSVGAPGEDGVPVLETSDEGPAFDPDAVYKKS